jgi:hypothetical protein
MGRFALGKVPLPDEDFEVRDRMTKTIPGVGDCPQRDGCMLEVMKQIGDLRTEFITRDNQLHSELSQIRSLLDNWLAAKGIRNTESTPASDRTAEVKTAGGTRVRAPVWAALVIMALLVVALAIWQVEEIAKLVK